MVSYELVLGVSNSSCTQIRQRLVLVAGKLGNTQDINRVKGNHTNRQTTSFIVASNLNLNDAQENR